MVHMRRAAPAHTATGVADALNGKYIYVTILQKLYISIATAHRDLLLCTRFLAGASTSMLADAPAAADAERARLRPTRLWLRLRARATAASASRPMRSSAPCAKHWSHVRPGSGPAAPRAEPGMRHQAVRSDRAASPRT